MEDVPHDLRGMAGQPWNGFCKTEGYSRYVVWQEGPIAAVLEAVARPRLGESPGRAYALGPAIGGTEIKSRCGATLIATDTQCEAKVEFVSVGHGDAPVFL